LNLKNKEYMLSLSRPKRAHKEKIKPTIEYLE
jgi:hypothetical protein